MDFHVHRSACAALMLLRTAYAAYSLSSAPGPTFFGVGGVSAGASSAQLLLYPQPQRDEILDLLFKPQYGASLHHLKVEIGGDGQSTEGVESSHQHGAGDPVNCHRGYEFELMAEARKRNPAIKLAGLPWAWPAWVGVDQTKTPFAHPDTAAGYVVAWVRCARDTWNVTVDYLGAWNERGFSVPYMRSLRAALDAAGFNSTRLICGDLPRTFECAVTVAGDPSFKAIVAVLGSHQPSGYDRVAAGTQLPMINSEAHYNVPDGSDWATVMNHAYIAFNLSGWTSWALVSAYDDDLAIGDHGLFRAWWPWCGHYEAIGRLWVTAHTSQFAAPDGDWVYLANRTGAGYLGSGGSYVGLRNARTGAWSLIIEKQRSDAGRPAVEAATFTLDAVLAAAAGPRLQAWRSTVPPAGSVPDNDTSSYFVQQAPIAVDAGGSFTVQVGVGDVWTVTTLTTGAKGGAGAPPPPAAPFPSTWADDFDGCPLDAPGRFWYDQNGAWECVSDSATPLRATTPTRGTVLRQVVPQHPIAWRPDETRPHSVLGSMRWRDVDAAIDFRLAAAGDTALLAARCWIDGKASGAAPITEENAMAGVWLALTPEREWRVFRNVANVSTTGTAVASGPLPQLVPGAWHTARLVVAGRTAAGYLDGAQLFAGLDVSWAALNGWVGIGTGDWGQHVDFDRVAVTAS